MSSVSEKTHPFHMVEPSKWPFLGSFGTFVMAIGAIFYMSEDLSENSSICFYIGLAIVLFTMCGWWMDVIKEANNGQDHTGTVRHGLRVGMVLFIVSEVMFFFAFFWAYFGASVPSLSRITSGIWPPEGIVPLETWDLPFLNTLILLTSGATVTYAHHAIQKGDNKRCGWGLLLTVILGVIFTCTQAFEYSHATFAFDQDIYTSTFYLATGFHGFHVIIGTIFLAVCYFRILKGHFTVEQHIGFEAAAWYWHFVDVVWLFLFCAVYWWGGSGYVHP
jgi:cytochrome c oxidase subunit 3